MLWGGGGGGEKRVGGHSLNYSQAGRAISLQYHFSKRKNGNMAAIRICMTISEKTIHMKVPWPQIHHFTFLIKLTDPSPKHLKKEKKHTQPEK